VCLLFPCPRFMSNGQCRQFETAGYAKLCINVAEMTFHRLSLIESFDAISLLLFPSLIADTISLSREVNPEAALGCFSN
jgi:hypothetical protein